MESESALVKVRFLLEQDADGWPPVASEGLWARQVDDDLYLIENTPWFARGIARGDVVQVHSTEDDTLWATGVTQESGRLVLRVTPTREGPLRGDADAVLQVFAPFGIEGETALPDWPLVALDIPWDADLAGIKSFLEFGVDDGSWTYEEGCVTEAWLTL